MPAELRGYGAVVAYEVHAVDGVGVDAGAVAGFAVGIVFLRAAAVPFYVTQGIADGEGQSHAGEPEGHLALGFQVVGNFHGTVAVDDVLVGVEDAVALHALDVEIFFLFPAGAREFGVGDVDVYPAVHFFGGER